MWCVEMTGTLLMVLRISSALLSMLSSIFPSHDDLVGKDNALTNSNNNDDDNDDVGVSLWKYWRKRTRPGHEYSESISLSPSEDLTSSCSTLLKMLYKPTIYLFIVPRDWT